MERRMPARSARYGQACSACIKTKCRCIPLSNGEGCERCHRLKRVCQSGETKTLRRQNDKEQSSSSDERLAKLEGALGQLVSLLQANNVQVGDIPNIPPQYQDQERLRSESATLDYNSPFVPTPSNLPSSGNSEEKVEQSNTSMTNNDDSTEASSWATGNENSYNTNPITIQESPSQLQSSETTCLQAFQRTKLHHCPFVYLSENITAEELHQEHPFLWRAIVSVMSPSTAERMTQAVELKQLLFKTVFSQDWSNEPLSLRQKLDMLQGLLVYIAWGWDHIHGNASLPRLMMAATLLARDMSLNDAKFRPTISLFDPKGFEDHNDSMELDGPDFLLERQRAVLAYFVLGSAISEYFPNIEAPRWSSQMDKCLAAIDTSRTNPKYRRDGPLGFQVRLQLLANKAAQACERSQLPDDPPSASLPAPVLQYIKRLLIQLQDIRASIPPEFQNHVFPLTHTYFTELCIISSIHDHEIKNISFKPSTTRPWYFWQSALAIKSCSSTFLTLSPSELLGISFIQWAQLARCIANLHDLYTIGNQRWDLTAVRRLIDMPTLLTSTAEQLELASAEAGEQPQDGVFAQLAHGIRSFQSSHYSAGELVNFSAQQRVDTAANLDVVMDAEQDYFSNPGLWLDQFLVDHGEQILPAT